MKKLFVIHLNVLSLLFFFSISHSSTLQKMEPVYSNNVKIRASYAKLPLSFIENKGQAGNNASYYLNGKEGAIFFTRQSIVYNLRSPLLKDSDLKKKKNTTFTLKPLGTNNETRLISGQRLPGRVNYLIGRNPENWHTDIPAYKEITYKNLYKGIDLKIYGKNNRMEYDFIVSPHTDPSKIHIACEGIDTLKINKAGDLIINTSLGEIRHLKPLIYQSIRGKKHIIDGSFRLSKNTFSFDIKKYNSHYPLIIDPLTLSYSTYLGGSAEDLGLSIAVDSSGNAYITGVTKSENFPTKDPYQATLPGNNSVFVTKINPSGDSLIYSTYIGGSSDDRARGIAVDSKGNAYITGETKSEKFPTNNPYQATLAGGFDAFVAKLTPSGMDLSFSTYLGGSLYDTGSSVAVDSSGGVYVAGVTNSENFPAVNAYQGTYGGGDYDAFVAKFSSTGNSLSYSTYIGGSGIDMSYGIAIDTAGNSYITGYTNSTDFPTTHAYRTTYQGGESDVFISKLNSSGNNLDYSTYLGAEGDDIGLGIDVDQSGCAYITGKTNSTGFPTANAYQATLSGDFDVFITKLSSIGNALAYSTYLGGSLDEVGYGISVDGGGNAYISGYTSSYDFPTKNAFQGIFGVNNDVFVSKIAPTGDTLSYSTYLGGNNDESSYAIDVGISGSAYITGLTASTNFPVENTYQGSYGGGIVDAFAARFDVREKYTWHVDGNVASSGDGRSWNKAFKTIQEAVIVGSGGDEIWVKKGTYKLSSPIYVPNAMEIYGGFAGSEIQRDQRDWRNNITKIDGQNSVYHCFYLPTSPTIDGFTITGGNNANGTIDDSGGGIFISQSAPSIVNCVITGNSSDYGGGGITNWKASPVIKNCIIYGNNAEIGGGGITNWKASPVITNCIIYGNNAEFGGGGIWNVENSFPVITNCVISENSAEGGGGGIWNDDDSSPDITNSIIWGNTAPADPQMLSDDSSSSSLTYCDFQGGLEGEGNIDSDPLFADPAQGNYHLQKFSPCIDKGNNNAPELSDKDFEGDLRKMDGDSNGTAIVDIGADEYIPSTGGNADGDVAPLGNRDGIVNVGDALVALRFTLGLETPTQEDKEHGDVAPLDAQGQPNPDGRISVGDALVILRKALGIIDF